MPAINFSSQFAAAVEAGTKRQTIRRVRKNPIRVGDKLTFYTEQRRKGCRKIGEGVVKEIVLFRLESRYRGCAFAAYENGEQLLPASFCALAYRDGFGDTDAFIAWFIDRYGLPFEGVIIRW